MQIEITADQNENGSQQGIETITLNGKRLSITGWFDSVAIWFATVTLSDEQLQSLFQEIRLANQQKIEE